MRNASARIGASALMAHAGDAINFHSDSPHRWKTAASCVGV